MLRFLRQVLHRWLSADRIRVSCNEGQWLALQPGQRVIGHDQLWQIKARDVVEDQDRIVVRYRLVVVGLDDRCDRFDQRRAIVIDSVDGFEAAPNLRVELDFENH